MRLALAAVLCVAATVAKAEPCWPPAAADAIAVRVLQSELTVGALACGAPEPYAAFIRNQSTALKRHGTELTEHYAALYGEKDGARARDALVTRLANEASTRKVAWTTDYCAFVQALTLRAAAAGRLAEFARAQPHARRALDDRACVAR